MIRRPIKRWTGILLRLLTAFAFMGLLFVLSGWALRPAVDRQAPLPDGETLARTESHRRMEMDLAHPPVLYREANYRQGEDASWRPKGESPLLADLVAAGKLPPVAERVGEEPLVVEGVDGIGRYGGTWVRLATDSADALNLSANRMSYAALLRFSPQGYPIVPHVAKDWEASEDHREFTFHLRKGMRWSDGHPFTADDVLYWWEQEVNDPAVTTEIPTEFRIRNESCQLIKVDDHTIRFVFPHPYGLFPTLMATHIGMRPLQSPKHYLAKYHPVTGDPDLAAQIMREFGLTNRRAVYHHVRRTDNPMIPRLWPWVYRTYREGTTQEFVRNPYYWMVDTQGNQLPYVDRVVYDAIGRQLLNIRASERGGVTLQARHIDYKDYTHLMSRREAGRYDIYHWYLADRSVYVVHPNLNRRVDPGDPGSATKSRLLQDARFRQALSLAIDRDAIIRAEYNGQAEPANCMPGPESPFYHERAYKAYTEHDPARANALLDEIGLTRRDLAGYRTAPDGERLIFYLDYSSFTGEGPAEFLVEDWAAIGLRVVSRESSRQLFHTEQMALRHDLSVWIGDCEQVPGLTARHMVPAVPRGSIYALDYTRWYYRGGLYDPSVTAGKRPPQDHPLYEAMVLYDRFKEFSGLEEQKIAFEPLLELAAENVWTINISTPPPYLAIVQNGFRNVPKTVAYSWVFQSPGNAGIETFYFEENTDSPATRNQIRGAIERATPIPGSVHREGEPQTVSPGHRIGPWIRILLSAVALLFVVMMVLKHPFVLRRLAVMIPTLGIISMIVFTIIQLPPGDYLTSRIMEMEAAGDAPNLQIIADLKEFFWLDDPMPVRYLRWMGVRWFATFRDADQGLLQGNMGRSMETTRKVNDIIGDRILLTFLISLGTILFTWALAIPIGIYSAVRQYSKGDYLFTFLGFLGMSFPGFLLALVLSVAAGGLTGLFSPEFKYQTEWNLAKGMDLLKHIWVPIVVMGISGTAGMIRIMRGNLLDELRKPYVVTAMAKGVRPLRLLFKYPVRLALNPFISGIGGLFPQLVSGGAIVAIVLQLPTVGPLMLSALMSQDMYLAGSMLMVLSLLSLFGTLVSDLLLLWVDPRIRFKGGSR